MDSETDHSTSLAANSDFPSRMYKRMKVRNKAEDNNTTSTSTYMDKDHLMSLHKTTSKNIKTSDPFMVPDLLQGLDTNKFGSVTEDIKALYARKMQMISSCIGVKPTVSFMKQPITDFEHQETADSEDDRRRNDVPAIPPSILIIDSDHENDEDESPCQKVVHRPKIIKVYRRKKWRHKISKFSDTVPSVVPTKPSGLCEKITPKENDVLEEQARNFTRSQSTLGKRVESFHELDIKTTSYVNLGVDKKVAVKEPSQKSVAADESQLDILTCNTTDDYADDGLVNVFPDMDMVIEKTNHQIEPEDDDDEDDDDDDMVDNCNNLVDPTHDGLADLWREMTLALECSKDNFEDALADNQIEQDEEECDHTFLLKDDLGYVCRVCGVIQRSIETIIDFTYNKVKRSTRTYVRESLNAKDIEPSQILALKLSDHGLTATHISAHPRHMKQMKPHQIEGFNFLCSNLVTENPGGCILAHAPGSGKTFMIISFMQSFLAKYPLARPLVVLPKGILSTWKREFRTWQVEDLPLFDFYSVKADSRVQQLEVLKQWMEQRSILFLGYKQFSTIICDSRNSKTSAACEEILLKGPSILILDEGHTPRNENTDILQSLAKVQTPRKVVLSGTLYQNHVKEVFNVLNLVRPKFLKMDGSKAVVKRIMSRVHIPGVRKQFKNGGDAVFYDSVEYTLQRDEDFKRKVRVIQDLREMTSKVLHYYKGDFLDELPGLVDYTVVLDLSSKQKNEVQKLKKFERKFKISSVGSAVYLHPTLNSFSENAVTEDCKMDDMIESINIKDGVKAKFFLNMINLCESAGEKLLVFSQYLVPLKFLERLAVKVKGWKPGREIFVISGESSSEHREWSMEQFNNSPDAKVFFGSIKACGEGISLVGASRVIILDIHLNPSVTRQAIGRAFRPGQKKKVYTYRLVAADSPEEADHTTCFKKELISKMWFEWNEYCGYQNFEVETVDVDECGDIFLESPLLKEDVKLLYKR